MTAQPPPTAVQLSSALTSQSLPAPSLAFLTSITNTSRHPPDRAIAVLAATAKHRLLHADLTSSPSLLSPSTPHLPPDIANVLVQERHLETDVFLQIIDIEDVSRSLWEQIEALESERKGETQSGREVIRVVASAPEVDGGETGSSMAAQPAAVSGTGGTTAPTRKGGPFKVLLQDWKGTRVWGFELKMVKKLGYPTWMGIGCKILLKRATTVARGLVLLDEGCCIVFGGKVDVLEKSWLDGRENRLRERVKREAEERRMAGDDDLDDTDDG